MGIYDADRDCVCAYEKYIAVCPDCGKEMLKKRMVTVLVKRGYSNPKAVMHLCEDCFAAMCDRYCISDK